jgi:hypothetical protein
MGWTYLWVLRMARAGLAYAAMLAASVSAGALGYAVIWAYTPDEPIVVAASVPAAVEVAAQPGPPGIVAPVIAAAQAPASEPVTASAPAMAAAPAEPLAPPVAMAIPLPRSRPQETVVVPQARPADAVRQSEESQTRPAPGVVTALPAEALAVRSTPAASSLPVTPREHAPVGSTTRPAPPVAAAPKPSAAPRLAALPPAHEAPPAPAIVSDAPQILVLRGGLRRATSVRPRRVAAAPAPDTAAQEAPSGMAPSIVAPRISVLRGGAAFRSAHTALLPPVKQPAIAVVRGAQSAASGLAGLARPGPLVLRIHD